MKPILFKTEMVKAILEGRKTQTRRVVKPQPVNNCKCFGTVTDSTDNKLIGQVGFGIENCVKSYAKMPCQPGDTLYVRETWKYYEKAVGCGKSFHVKKFLAYKADEEIDTVQKSCEWYEGKWRPSIHMPREAARIFLKVTDVRVERLWEMRLTDYAHEGIIANPEGGFLRSKYDASKQFQKLWDNTIKRQDLNCYGWDANPWVFVVEFEKVSQ